MQETIEKLLILQENDRKIARARSELQNLDPQRQRLQQKLSQAEKALEQARHHAHQLESNRHAKEVEVESKNQLIRKYTEQQFQTKKNDEYQALTHEIDRNKQQIAQLEEEQLELMEQIEAAEKEVEKAKKAYEETKQEVERERGELDEREGLLKSQLDEYRSKREELQQPIDANTLRRYDRLLQQRGATAVVPIDHSVCGGCHMKLPPQVTVTCKGQKELVQCPNCSRILYYTREMDMS